MIDAPVRAAACPATARLDAFSVGDEATLAEHVSQCPHCGPYVEALRAHTDAFRRARPTELFLKQVERRARPERRWGWPALAAAAAVALGLVLVFAQQWGQSEVPRLKGAGFHVFLKRGEAEAAAVMNDQTVIAGDRVRFSFEATKPGHLAIFQLDGTEQVETRAHQRVATGQVMLPGATALDEAIGPEWFISVFSSQALDVEQLAAQLRGQSHHASITLECADCQVESIRVLKAAP